jgi:hypothetical protein
MVRIPTPKHSALRDDDRVTIASVQDANALREP